MPRCAPRAASNRPGRRRRLKHLDSTSRASRPDGPQDPAHRYHREILRGPVGIDTITSAINEEPDTIERRLRAQPHQCGVPPPARRGGRVATERAYLHFGLPPRRNDQGSLFLYEGLLRGGPPTAMSAPPHTPSPPRCSAPDPDPRHRHRGDRGVLLVRRPRRSGEVWRLGAPAWRCGTRFARAERQEINDEEVDRLTRERKLLSDPARLEPVIRPSSATSAPARSSSSRGRALRS
jgi:hypothetical protein